MKEPMLTFNPDRVLANARKSSTEDLLNRITVYRAGMEPEAIRIIEDELYNRGITQAEILAYEERMAAVTLADPNGVALKCSFCHEPAVERRWGWHRLFGKLPVFPRLLRYCREHRRGSPAEDAEPLGDEGKRPVDTRIQEK
jgi:hypothetical protein